MSNYVLATFHGTIVCVVDDGRVVHREIEIAAETLQFEATGIPDLKSARSNYSYFDKAVFDYKNGLVSFSYEDGFLCADLNGEFSRRPVLEAWETFKLVPVELFDRLRNAKPPELPLKNYLHSIPLRIHQTFSTERVPDAFVENVGNLTSMNPAWQYTYYSDKSVHDFIYSYYGWNILNAYLKINCRYGAARADLFRYLCVYQFGGVYLDMKSSCNVPFNKLIQHDDQFILAQWEQGPGKGYNGWGMQPELGDVPGGEYQNWHIISAPGHPFLKAVIESVLRKIWSYDESVSGTGKVAALRVTGPIAYTKAIYPIRASHSCRVLDTGNSPLVYNCVQAYEQTFASKYRAEKTPLVL